MRTISFGLIIAVALLISCSDEPSSDNSNVNSAKSVDPSIKKTSIPDSTIDCSGVGNLVVDSAVADAMIKLFSKHYIKEGSATPILDLEKSVWIDSCVIAGFTKYFKDHNDFDGARFYSGAKSSNNKSTIILTPTTKNTGSGSNKHLDALSANITVEPINCNKEFKNFNLSENEFHRLKDKFNHDFRKNNLVDSLSISVWISSCVFTGLTELIRANNTLLDGVNVYFAAYDELKPSGRRGQKYKHQSTIIIVPTMPNRRGGHRDNWEILKVSPLYQKYINFDGGFNHGELCPDVCNEG